MVWAEEPHSERQQSGELVPRPNGVSRLAGPAGKFAPGGQGIRVLTAEHALHHRQQGGELVARGSGVACLAGQLGKLAPGGQSVRVLAAQHPLHHVQQGGQLVPRRGRPLRQRQSRSLRPT